jgi:hypothetical protein
MHNLTYAVDCDRSMKRTCRSQCRSADRGECVTSSRLFRRDLMVELGDEFLNLALDLVADRANLLER